MPLHSAPHFAELGSLKTTTRTWYHSARSLANCLLLRPTHCLDHHSWRKQRSTSSSSKLCDKLMAVASINLTKGPPVLHTAGGGGQILRPLKKRQSTLLQKRSKKPGCPSESADQVPPMTRTSCTRIFNNKRICNHIIVHFSQRSFMNPQTAQLSLQVAGRLSHFLHNWRVLTTDKWVIDTVKSFQIPFYGPPTGMQAKCFYILHRATPSDSRRDKGFVGKGCCPSVQPSTSREFLLDSLSGTQDRRSNEASDKLEKAK